MGCDPIATHRPAEKNGKPTAIMETDLSFLKNVPIFNELDETALRLVLEKSRTRKLRKGVILMSEGETGESLYLIHSGKIKIFVSDEDGNEMTLFVEGPGSYIGEISLLDDSPRTASAITLENTEVISISKKDFMDVITENPDIAFNIINALTQKMRRATESIRSLALRNVYQRLVLKLLELSDEEDGFKVITTKYSHLELGKMIGASREMVGKVMAELTRGEYVEEREKKLYLLKDFPHDW